MKIAVYGDSFSIINTKWQTNLAEYQPHLGKSWVDILAEEHEITNYAESGSAFMYSYELFLAHHNEHDLNIVVVTHPQRVYIKALGGILMFGPVWADCEYDRIKKMAWYPRKDTHLDILQSARNYITEWADFKMITHVQHVLVNNLWNLKENTLVIPAFEESIEQTTTNLNRLARYELSLVDPESFKKFDYGLLNCKRKCHFSKENNVVLAKFILDAIQQKKRIVEVEESDLVTPSNKNFEFYATEHMI
jgi:hypothetical protein